MPEAVRKHWVELLGNYLQTRQQLIGLVLIMDCRHPLKPLDIQMLDFCADPQARAYFVVESRQIIQE